MTTQSADREDARVSLVFKVTAILRNKLGLHEQFAVPMAEAVADGLCEQLGGELNYIPAASKAARNDAIRREFNGRNAIEICRKFEISKTSLYRIVGEGR